MTQELEKPKRTSKQNIQLGVFILAMLCLVCFVIGLSATSGKRQEAAQQAKPTALDIAAIKTETAATVIAEQQAQPIQPRKTRVVAVVVTSTPKAIIRPTDIPTEIPPTKTPIPPTPAPEPVILTGSGDTVLDINKWDGAALIKFEYIGDSNFIVQNFDNGNMLDILVNKIGNYSGIRPLDFATDEHTTRLEIKADGQWIISILPLSAARLEKIPGVISGNGDDVIVITGGTPDLLKSNYPGDRNFIILSYGNNGKDILVNKIGPYKGQTVMDDSVVTLEIIATGPWSIEITTK